MAEYKKKQKFNSPVGTAGYAWLNKPDTKFDDDGVYTVKLILEGDDATAFQKLIDGLVDAAWDELTADWTNGKKKNHSKYHPYKPEEDDEGDPTGRTVFNLKQNAVINTKKGERIEVKIPLYDRFGRKTTKAIFPGSKIETEFSTRSWVQSKDKEVGITLDLSAVLVREFAESTGGGNQSAEGRGFNVDQGEPDEPAEDSAEGSGFNSEGGAPADENPDF